jgi:serum/glucocorticoid-regulated kinase 2
LLFSDKLKKINMFGWNQERILAITTEFIYNLKKNKPKRKTPITSLGGLSKTLGSNKAEFTLHVPTQYDYRFLSER